MEIRPELTRSEWQVRHRQELACDRHGRHLTSPRDMQHQVDMQIVLDLLDEERQSLREVAALAEQSCQLVLSYREQIVALQAELHVFDDWRP